jgi:conjugative transfer signal peptidase TraF
MSAAESARMRRRFGRVLRILLFAAAPIILAVLLAPSFTWNVSASLPRGLYLVDAGATPERGSVVSFRPPTLAAGLIAARGYLPPNARLLKVVVALPGDRACVDGDVVSVNGDAWGNVARRDFAGRSLEPSTFCGPVPAGRAFVATAAPRSFDSRYFGPVALSSLTVVRPLWTY